MTALSDRPKVPIDNSSEASWVYTPDGRAWVAKSETDTGFQPLLAEALCWLLGRELGLRIPDATVYDAGGELAWLSARVAPVIHWGAQHLHYLNDLRVLGRVMAFDALVLNEDRHAGNLLVQPAPDELHLDLWAIDSGNAIVGWLDEFVTAGMRPLELRNLAPGLRGAADLMEAGAMELAERARWLDRPLVAEMVQEACELAREPKVSDLRDALCIRLNNAPVHVRGYLDQLRERS